MTFPAKSNMYEVNATSTLEVYGDFIHAAGESLIIVISTRALSSDAQTALESSVFALGYGKNAATYAVTTLGGGGALGAADLANVVEGLDPLALIVADGQAAELLSRAYRARVAPDGAARVMGRTVIAFRNFEDMLGSSAEKQRAWALLKKLPRL